MQVVPICAILMDEMVWHGKVSSKIFTFVAQWQCAVEQV